MAGRRSLKLGRSMSARFAKPLAAIGLLLAAWGLTLLRESESFVRAPSAGNPGPARILRFYASIGTVLPGQKALICYGVENTKTVRISPWMAGVTPSLRRCLEVFPDPPAPPCAQPTHPS